MTTYNSYEAAKIANPESDIYEFEGYFSSFKGIGSKKCNPADCRMTIEKFLDDGYKFVDGDAFLNSRGEVVIITNAQSNNRIIGGDERRFVLRAAALENIPTETPEEKEVLDGIESAGDVEWDGEGLPPVGAIYTLDPNYDIELLCKYSSEYVVVGEMLPEETYRGMEVIVDTMTQRDRTFRKPETPQQREDRERLENGKSLHNAASKTEEAISHGIFRLWEMEDEEVRRHYCQLAEIIGYKKEKAHGTN